MTRINYIALLLLAMFCTYFSANSQNSTFAYAYNFEGKTVSIDSESSDHFGYKFQTAQDVLDKLVEAMGTPTMTAPQLIMNNAEQKPASINVQLAQIYLEEKAYKICTDFGPDSLSALAILLSHELIHYYEKHNWENHFLSLYGNELNELNHEAWENQIKLELQADQLGGFLANMAGYNTSGIIKNLLTKIYDEYHLNHEHSKSHYPNLDERINIALKGEKQLALMNQAFEISNYFCIAGQFELAFKYLDYIIIESNFQSRELYNNRGVLLSLSALLYIGQSKMPYMLPFEVDQSSRLSRKASNQQISTKYINQAISSLKTAIAMDENYLPAYINLASAYILQGEYFEAEYLCQKILKKANEHEDRIEISNAYLNLGIIKALENDKVPAQNYFEQSKAINPSELNKLNIQILDQKKIQAEPIAEVFELSMDTVKLNQLYSRIMRDQEYPISHIKINKDIDFYSIQKPSSQIYIDLQNFGDNGYHFFQKGNKIKVGMESLNLQTKKQELDKLLGQPSHGVPLTNGMLSAYNSGKLFVRYDHNNNIKEFIIYHRSK